MTGKEKLRLVATAALLIKNDIKDVTTSRDNYPSSQDMAFPPIAAKIN